jgi:hypothetical protein
LTENRLRHLPAMDGGQLIGLISIGERAPVSSVSLDIGHGVVAPFEWLHCSRS